MGQESKKKGGQQANNNNNQQSSGKKQQQSSAGKQNHHANDVSFNAKKATADNRQVNNGKSQPVKSSANQPLTVVDKVFATILIVAALVLVLAVTHLADTGRLSVLQPRDRQSVLKSLDSYASKLEFTAKYWIIGLVWLYFHIHVLIGNRIMTKASNPLAGSEDRVQAEKNVFTNSIEQFILLIVSQASALPYLTAERVLTLIPLFNGLFFVGRVLFWLGYPKRRSFGMVMGMFPSSIAIIFTTYNFVTLHLDPNPDSLFKLNL